MAAKSVAVAEEKGSVAPEVRALIAGDLGWLIAFRRDLHAHPELAYQEQRTSRTVRGELEKLSSAGLKVRSGLARGTGVLAYLPPTEKGNEAKPSIGLRADMDALPIQENTGRAYASATPGVMHACGHDGHTAMLLGAARALCKVRHRARGVHFVFQPAEEQGAGANAMCEDGILDGELLGPKIERMYGLHGWPMFDLNCVGTRAGALLASTDDFAVTIEGEQSHAAYPHFSRDAVLCASQCVVSLQQIVARNSSPFENVVCSVTILRAGSATNVIPSEARFEGTVRTLTPGARELAKTRLFEIVNGTASAHGCRAHIDWQEGYPVTYNDPALTERWFATAKRALGESRVREIPEPTMGGEDFSYYARRVPSVFFLLGLRRPSDANPATLHQPEFDFNDEAIGTGVEMLVALATEG